MWEKIKAWFSALFGKPETPVAVPEPKVEEPAATEEPMIPVRVAEEMVREALEEPTSEELQGGEVEEPTEEDREEAGVEPEEIMVWIKNTAHKFKSQADADRFRGANWEPTLHEGIWRGRRVRPADSDPGWVHYKRYFTTFGYGTKDPWIPHSVWIDPSTKRIEWQDGPNQFGSGKFPGSTGAGHYHIGRGNQDLTANPGSFRWTGSDPRIELKGEELKMARIRSYKGGTPPDLASWPRVYKEAYRESH